MTEAHWDVAPGDRPAIPASEQTASSGFLVYTIGLVLAVILTATSFWVANTSLIWAPGVMAGLFVLAIVIYDLRRRGRVHPVTLWGGLALILSFPLRLAIGKTESWLNFAAWLVR